MHADKQPINPMHNKNIGIPETCSQSWQKMTTVENGRHCEQCNKNVIDFTVMSNAEIITHLATKNNICGRINQLQLDQLNDSLADKNKRRFKWDHFVAIVYVISLFIFSKAYTKTKPVYTTEQAAVKKRDFNNTDTIYKTIKGKIVIDDYHGELLEINIHVRGTKVNGVADKKGRFKLKVPVYADTLEVRTGVAMGQYVKIGPNGSIYHINLNNGFVRMGGMQIKPVQKFNKELLIRSAREIGTIKF